MATDYDPIAEQYKRSKQTPWRTYVECFTLLETIGPIEGLAVLDVACGEGFYTRLLRHRGASRVMGVDLSEGMVDLARKQQAQAPLGIAYCAGDGRALDLGREYDLAVAAYLLNYATTREELGAMCDSIARCLRPGGRLAGFGTVRWHPPRLSAEGAARHGPEFWKTFLESPPVTFIECIK
jgi:SAM-dependent methyltransferase